jgi:hypothetical protein
VPHFLGLHALQVLPLVALLLGRLPIRRRTRANLVMIAAASYASLYALLVTQAFRGIPLSAPDSTTLAQLGVWVMGTALAVALALRGGSRATQQSVVV